MFRNYFKIAWRNLTRNKTFSLTNLLGLTIGITSTLFILLWVHHELSWDKFHANYKSTWQVYANRNFNGDIYTDNAIILPLANAMEQELPQVEYAAFSSYAESHVLQLGEKQLKKSGFRVSSHYFNIFSWKFIRGNAATALSYPDAIVLTESAAKGFFGSEDPVNKILRLDNAFDVKVSAVVQDAPGASSLSFDFITPFNYSPEAMQDWNNSYTNLFVKTKDGARGETLGTQIDELVKKHTDAKLSAYFAHPMSKWRLYSDFKDGKNTGGMIEYVRLFTIIAIVILVIACVNFMNLSTARSEKRAKEVGVRKTLGSTRKHLVLQFFSESVILALLSFVISVILVYLLLPGFNTLVDKALVLQVDKIEFWIAGAGIILFTGLFAGSYPAFYLSSFNPVKVLKGTFLPGKKAMLPRKILVVGQFVISILLISATVIVYRQIEHVKSRDIGYNPSNLLMLPSSEQANTNFAAIRQELLQSGMVNSVTRTSSPLTDIWNYTPAPDYEGKPEGDMIVSGMGVTEDFVKTTGIKLIEGREFTGVPADTSSLLLNEAAVKTMGLKNPVGTPMRYHDRNYTVIGVIGNVVMSSPYKPVDPMMLLYRPRNPAFISIRLSKGVKPKQALASIERIFKKHNPAFPFEYQFTDQQFSDKFITEELISKLTNIFAGLSIFICCLGLSGLAAFTIQKRFREIGIRKVLGASVRQLLFMLSKEFLYLVGIALLVAVPLTWWGMQNWLQQYAYRIEISIWYFVIAGAGVLLLTLLTVSLNAIRAAIMKPAESLRAE